MGNLNRLVLVLIVLVAVACQTDSGVKLGFLYTTPETARYVREAAYFKEFAESKGVSVFVEHGNGDAAIQYQKAIELFDKGIDGLAIIAINANTAAAIVREGQERGIKVMAYNRLIKNCEPDFFISGDNDVIGRLAVEELVKAKPSGEAIILGGDKYDRNAIELMTATKSYLKPYLESGKITLGYVTYVEEWGAENAAYELEQYMSFTGRVPDLIFAGFDGIANGCIQMLEAHGVDKQVYISGQDATIEGVRNILAGKQQVTAFHPLKEASVKAAEVLIELIRHNKKAQDVAETFVNNGQFDVPTIKVPSVTITKENLEQVMVRETGFYTKEEIYQ